MKAIRTSDMAKAAGVHPNTIRAYEKLGLISPVQREKNGYRLFTELHLYQVKLIRLNLKCTYLGGRICETAYEILRLAAGKNLADALAMARNLLNMLTKERDYAAEALEYLEAWAGGQDTYDETIKLQTRDVAELIGVTIDMLYNWERNGLVKIPRLDNGYRAFGDYEIKRLRVIRMLRQAGYGNMSILRVMRHLDGGNREDIKKIIDTPEPDDEIVYIGFSDNWMTSLDTSIKSAAQAVKLLCAMVKKFGKGGLERVRET